MKYYVYIAKFEERVVYIGKGSGDRYKHLNSGISSCYMANKYHFEGKSLDVHIFETFEDEKEALQREAELIQELKPEWNMQIKGRKPGFYPSKGGKGVQLMNKRINPWRAFYKKNGKKTHIGYYATEEAALRARAEVIEALTR